MEKVNPFLLYKVLSNIQDTQTALEFAAYLESIDYQLEAIANQNGMKEQFLIQKNRAWERFGWSCVAN
jgi:hypothetical protein